MKCKSKDIERSRHGRMNETTTSIQSNQSIKGFTKGILSSSKEEGID